MQCTINLWYHGLKEITVRGFVVLMQAWPDAMLNRGKKFFTHIYSPHLEHTEYPVMGSERS